jgi:hypothetical protein
MKHKRLNEFFFWLAGTMGILLLAFWAKLSDILDQIEDDHSSSGED